MSQILRTKSGVCFKTAGTPSERAANARPHAHLGFFMSAAGPAARKLYHKTAAAALLSDIVFPENGKSASICAARQSRLRRLDPESLLFRLPGRYRSSERKAGISPKDVRLGDSLILCGGLPPCICKGHPFAKGEPHSEMLCRRLSWSVSPPKNGAEQSLPPTPRSDKIHERIRPFPKKHLNFPETSCIIAEESAGVMELVDVADSKSAGGDTVWVRVPPPAPCRSKRHIACSDFFSKVRAHLLCGSFSPKPAPLCWAPVWFWAQTQKLKY